MRLVPVPLLVPLLILAGCIHAPIARPPDGAEEDASFYRTGDFVVYRYQGLFTEEPVELRETVLAREGTRLEIEVAARRGLEKRRWIQVVTDTPENRALNQVDELYEWVDGSRVRLANERNRDLARLHQWTVLELDGAARDRREIACTRSIGGMDHACICKEARLDWHGRTLRSSLSECPGFRWTHGPGRIWDEGSDEDAWRLEVLDHGRRD